MASSKRSFTRVRDIDDKNLLSIDLDDLKQKRNDLQDWPPTIDRLSQIGNRLKQLEDFGGKSKFSGHYDYYKEGLRWLKGVAPTTSWIGLPAVGNVDSIDQNNLNQFRDTWIQNLENTLNEQTFLNFEQAVNQVREAVAHINDFKLSDDAEIVFNKLQEKSSVIEENFTSTLDEKKKAAIKEIGAAQGIAKWVAFYESVETEYTELLEKNQWRKKSASRNPKSKKRHSLIEHLTDALLGWKVKLSLSRKRNLWLASLFVVFVFSFIATTFEDINFDFLFLHLDIQNNSLATATSFNGKLANKLTLLPILIVPILGYTFSNKNYRIYSNLREQYRHRKTVASTLQGIIRSIDEKGENKDVRQKLVEVGAAAMFELKTVGHLSRKESEHSPTNEIIQTIIPR